jgi:hypothetical protein
MTDISAQKASATITLQGSLSRIAPLMNRIFFWTDGRILSYWMFALIIIGFIFIIFLGISIYILW